MEAALERDWLTKEEAEAFVGKNASFYLEKWKDHPDTAFKGWNWAAAFFGIEWMAYRKMYRETALSLGLLFVLALFLALLGLEGEWIGHGFRILIGAVGNALYRKKALRALRQTAGLDDFARLGLLAQKGGASPASLAVMLLLELGWAVLLFV